MLYCPLNEKAQSQLSKDLLMAKNKLNSNQSLTV